VQLAEFCREIETYLCRKNDGHLIRVTGPSFDLVAGWASEGVPLNVAFAGIDRYFERYYRSGPRRRPVRIDFCEADVLDVFDEWKRATGIVVSRQSAVGSRQSSVGSRQSSVGSRESSVGSRESSVVSPESSVVGRQSSGEGRQSLPEHLKRVVMRLSEARAADSLGPGFDDVIDCVAHELDEVRGEARSIRGERRRQIIDRLAALDMELLRLARQRLDAPAQADLDREADAELAPFKSGMTAEAFARAREAAVDRLVRRRGRLPTIAFG